MNLPKGWTAKDSHHYNNEEKNIYLCTGACGDGSGWSLRGYGFENTLSAADTAIRLCGAREPSDLREDLARSRAETRAAIESRDLADKEIEVLKAQLTAAYRPAPPYDPAFIKPLVAWMAREGVHEALANAAIHTVEQGTVTAEQAIEARRDPVAMARLILETPAPFEVPF